MKAKGLRIAVVDLETTGSHLDQGDQIIQIGAVLIEDGQVLAQHSMLLNPERDIPTHITAITGIQPDQVQDAPTFSQVAGLWYERLKDCFFVAHNLGFDLTFLQAKFAEQGLDFQPPALDTVQLAKIFLPQAPGFNLQDLSQFFGLNFQDAHDALGDARMTAHLLDVLAHQAADLDYGTKLALQAIFKALPYQASQFLNQANSFYCQVSWPEGQGDSQSQASHASLISAKQRTAVAYWQEAGQDKSPLVLEAQARQDHQGLALALLHAWRQEGDKALLVLENEGQISHWQALWQEVTGQQAGLYRPAYQFIDMASVYQFCHEFDLSRANQQELTVLAAALVWLTNSQFGCLDELNSELDISQIMRRYDFVAKTGKKVGYHRYLEGFKTKDLILINQKDWLSLKQVADSPLAFLGQARVLVLDLEASYQGLVDQEGTTLDASQLFVELKALLDQGQAEAQLESCLATSYDLLESMRAEFEASDLGNASNDWWTACLVKSSPRYLTVMAQVATLGQQLQDWLKTAKLGAKQKRTYRHLATTCRLLATQSEGSYVRLQGQVSNGQIYQLALSRVPLIMTNKHLPQLSQYQQIAFLSDGQYDQPLGYGLARFWQVGATYLSLPEQSQANSLTLQVPLAYAQSGQGYEEAEQLLAFIKDYLAEKGASHVLILANNKAQAQTYYRLLWESSLLEEGYLIYSQGQNGSLKKIKRRAEADDKAIVIVPRRLFLEESFTLSVDQLLVVLDRLPFDSLTHERTLGQSQVLGLSDNQAFDQLTLPQMIFRLKKLLAQVASSSCKADHYLLDERVWTRYYSPKVEEYLAPAIDLVPILPSH